jgi:transposase
MDSGNHRAPGRTENDAEDPTLVHALRAIPDKGFRVLRVIYNETRDPMTVVTIYFDDEMSDL